MVWCVACVLAVYKDCNFLLVGLQWALCIDTIHTCLTASDNVQTPPFPIDFSFQTIY